MTKTTHDPEHAGGIPGAEVLPKVLATKVGNG